MNRKWKEKKQKDPKNSPVLFEDEEKGTSSSDEVKLSKSTTPVETKMYSEHSTPIQRKIDSSEFPEMDYNESPIEPMTQHPPSEVGWDYQRPVTKEEDGNNSDNMNITKTPKRGVFLTKKRNSNSPLLYKPMKKKLIQEEQQENMEVFVKELKAMEKKAKEMKDKKGEKTDSPPESEESQLVVEMDSQCNDSDIKLQVSINVDESPNQGKITLPNKNYQALLDDSIEDIMVMCSQEVEAKEFGNKKDESTPQPVNHSATNKSNEGIPLKTSPSLSLEESFKNLAKENVQPLNAQKNTNDTSCKNSNSISKGNLVSLEIPDDFFDEFDDKDFCKNADTEVHISSSTIKSVNKNNTKPILAKTNTVANSRTRYIEQSKNSALATYNCVSDYQASNASVQTKIVNTKANFGYLNKDYAVRNSESSGFYSQSQSIQSAVTSNNDTRLFKSKSYSDSNFQVYNKTNYNKMNNCGRLQSTPAEIERKRQEAIMKRKAKMKTQSSSALMQNSIKQ